jgi:hypothetical protein
MSDSPLDPFWSVVRRRHPDVDLVLLPAEARDLPEPPPGVEPLEVTDELVARLDAAGPDAWRLLVDTDVPESAARWMPAPTPDGVRRELTLAREGVDPVAGAALVQGATTILLAQGWRVLAPPDGMPRVLASREANGELVGREELQLVLVPATGRLLLRLRSADVPVTHRVAHDLVTGERR